ncbi:MAG: TRAP transporter substrate-binding protein [Deltaproteobacteria bacterium]|mgnify:CR=1 FL=1|nr:TRAP transporter substrate-binding protein [Deltaproteobacteria bacterium]MBW1934353.1 TRAP transporter substrate-binding protein [Deltaproteobacteria bacterium]MBW1978469.1 TRAP transporter substrate-binding protein [Deltaproteobacteria bacterium]MBW2043463.1 TRAP transporter substrate-binding protein [Deltaproteobacteria bacterium]MBW2299417.1 TRAP transporter substrate-binding protein [Deltaproteobacteria bacterium]
MKKARRILLSCAVALISVAFAVGVHPPQARAKKIELSLANEAPPFFVYTVVSKKFKQMLEDKIGDKVNIKIYHSGQLGGEKDTIEGEIIGTVDMAIVQSSLLALWEPQMVYIDIPFLYRSVDHAIKVMNGPIGQSINKKMEKHGVMVLACMNLGFRGIYNRHRPIYKPSDVAGMKYRVIQNPLYVDVINSWGAKAVPMNFGEVYTALQQGVLDAAGLEPYSYEIMKHYEVAPYFSITNHIYQSFVLTMSKKKFDSLPADVQRAILDTAKAVIPVGVKITKDIDYRIIGKLVRENKVLFNVADIDAFRKASQSVSDKYSRKVGTDIIRQIKAVK